MKAPSTNDAIQHESATATGHHMPLLTELADFFRSHIYKHAAPSGAFRPALLGRSRREARRGIREPPSAPVADTILTFPSKDPCKQRPRAQGASKRKPPREDRTNSCFRPWKRRLNSI